MKLLPTIVAIGATLSCCTTAVLADEQPIDVLIEPVYLAAKGSGGIKHRIAMSKTLVTEVHEATRLRYILTVQI